MTRTRRCGCTWGWAAETSRRRTWAASGAAGPSCWTATRRAGVEIGDLRSRGTGRGAAVEGDVDIPRTGRGAAEARFG